jgi:hypothetical protein
MYVCPKGLSVYETKFQGLSLRLGYTLISAEKSWPSNVNYGCVCVCVCVYTHIRVLVSLVTPFVFLSIGL